MWKDGAPSYSFDRERARQTVRNEIDALPPEWRAPVRDMEPPRAALTPSLQALAAEVGATSDTT